MVKRVKKWFRYLLIVSAILLAIPLLAYVVIQIPAVQTVVVNKITEKLSDNLQSEISIGRVDYRFFNKLALSDVLFLDLNRDTLLFADKISAGIRKLEFKKRIIHLGRVSLTQPEVSLISDSTGRMNLTWYIEKLRSGKDTSSAGMDLTIDRVDITSGRFAVIRPGDSINKKIKIDLTSLVMETINGTVENFRISNDTTRFSVYDLAFREKSGFLVKKMYSDIIISGSSIFLESALIQCDTTLLDISRFGMRPDTATGFRNFTENVRLNLTLNKSLIHTSDLGFFAPIPEGFDESFNLSGRFSGTIAELRGRDVSVYYGDNTFLDCDFDISGLPRIDESFIYLGFNELHTNAADLQKIVRKNGEKRQLPEIISKLGDINFDGSFSGFTTDFVTYGEFTSDVGEIRTDISLRPEKNNIYRVQGLINGRHIDLKEITGSELLGNLNIHANIDGSASSFNKFSGNLTGMIDSVFINGYKYQNIDLKGRFTEKTWDGSINVEDDNIALDLLGMFNFSDTLPEFDFTLNLAKADLYNLNIDKKDSTSKLTMLLTSNFRGNSIDNLDGEIKLLNSDFTRYGKTMELYDFSLRTFTENSSPVLSLRTDFVDVTVRGNYNFEGLKHTFAMMSSNLMPSLVAPEKESEELSHNNFTFEINLRNTNRINDFFRTGLLLAEKSYLRGAVAPDSLLTVEGKADFISYRNIRFNNFDFLAGINGKELQADLKTSSVVLPGQTSLVDFGISFTTVPDTFYIETAWDSQSQPLNQGVLTAMGSISKSLRGSPVLRIDIDSSTVYASDNLWNISKASVVLDSSSVAINNVNVESNEKFYHASGTISEDPADTLRLNFNGIDIQPLNDISKATVKDTAGIKMNLRGLLNGRIALTGVYSNLMLESDIIINGFSMLGSEYGDIFINSAFDRTREVVDIAAHNDRAGVRMFDVDGYYDPGNKSFNIGFDASRLPVEALNPLLKSFASDISGFATGKLRLTGTSGNLVLRGAVKPDNLKLKINFLQTLYTLNDSVRFDRAGIRFNNVRFSDEEGKTSVISGNIYHRNFRNYTADLTINMGNNFLVLNTQMKDNPSFYGRVYASGVTRIKTSPELLSFDISARTGNNSRFFIPLTDELSVAEYSFVKFIDAGHEEKTEPGFEPEPPKELGIDLNIDLTVTPDATAELIFDEKVGDKITGSGSGLLNIRMSPKEDIQMTGDYTIEKGTYLFTLGNIVNKRFEVENGGRISFNGDLEDAEIELKAIYQKFSTSLFPVTQDQRDLQRRYAVEPQLLLSGRLFNPTVKFEIILPNADEEARTQLRNAIASDEILSRQFMYLLVTNSFYSDQASSSSGYSPSGTSAMAATTIEMISNQLSNWISQINENVNLGLTYRPGSGNRELDPDEVQVAFETQMLDDRVIINGNFDYRTNSGSTERLTGDFEAEVRLTDKLRFKVFNRFNDTYTGKGPYTQGVGIFYREDFGKLSELFRKKEKTEAKKEEEVTLLEE